MNGRTFYGAVVGAKKATAVVPRPQTADEPDETLCISQVCIPATSALPLNTRISLLAKVGDEDPVCIATLKTGHVDTVTISVLLDEYAELTVAGHKGAEVHVSGYYAPKQTYGMDDDEGEEEEEEEEGEATLTDRIQNVEECLYKMLTEQADGDDDEEESFDEDDEEDDVVPVKHVKHTRIEEITEDIPETNGNKNHKTKDVKSTGKQANQEVEDDESDDDDDDADTQMDMVDMDDDDEEDDDEDDEEEEEGGDDEDDEEDDDEEDEEEEAEREEMLRQIEAENAKRTSAKKRKAEEVKIDEGSKRAKAEKKVFGNGFEIESVKTGSANGKVAKPGKRVVVKYRGTLKSNGKVFDETKGNKTFSFRLGVGEVIKGWDKGLAGMRVGDKRKLTVPPSLAYGDVGVKKVIPPNSTLLFDVELVDVR